MTTGLGGTAPRGRVKTGFYSSAPVNAVILGLFLAGFVGMALTTTWYQTFKALHVLAAVIWIGGSFMIQLFAFRILQSDDPRRMAAFAKDVEVIGTRTFIPASLVLVVLGFVLVHKGNWGYPFWIVFALVVWGISVAVGAGFLGPESGRIGKLVEEQGPESREVGARIERILLFSRVELMLLALVVVDMVFKPG